MVILILLSIVMYVTAGSSAVFDKFITIKGVDKSKLLSFEHFDNKFEENVMCEVYSNNICKSQRKKAKDMVEKAHESYKMSNADIFAKAQFTEDYIKAQIGILDTLITYDYRNAN